MAELIRSDATELAELLASGEVSSREITQASLDRIDAVDPQVKAFLHVAADSALAAADAVDAARAAGDELHPLAGVPIAVKDAVVTSGMPTTAGSRMLEGWVSPYDATIVQRLKAAGMPILGKTNMDEFAMGSSTEHSAFGPTHNPWDLNRIPGGSGGGSAAAVAAFEAPLAIGTDTGGSIRQPAAVTGTVGVKPTYGTVSRSGVIALASSLDQVGPVARTVRDAALLHSVIGGHDPLDSTSLPGTVPDFADVVRNADLTGMRIGLLSDFGDAEFESGVRERFEEAVALVRAAGAEVSEVSCPSFVHGLAAYYVLLPSEASSNLAKFDAIRFGNRVLPEGIDSPSAEQVTIASRTAGFGTEVKRRLILGTYALSAGHFDEYYMAAQQVRTLIAQDFARAFESVDVIMSPTSPSTAWEIGYKVDDPLSMYLSDIATVPANMAGIPGISVPAGLADGLPVGVQFLAPARADDRVYRAGAALEALLVDKWGGPLLNSAPELTEAR